MEESKERTVLRTQFTKHANELVNLLDSHASINDVNARYQLLHAKYNQLEMVSDAIVQKMYSDENSSAEMIDQELDKSGEYSLRFLTLKGRVDEYIKQASEEQKVPGVEQPVLPERSSPLNHLGLKMKREIRLFDGHVSNWIKFWSQFSQIHDNPKFSPEAKFDFLLQYIKPGSLAEKLVENFPPSGENYPKVIELLKSRCGKDDSLIEYYVREMLALVLGSRDGASVTSFYDQLASQLRALESLGVTEDKYAAILFPLVESAVPAPIFRTWERYRVDKGASMSNPSRCLTELMQFLKVEVESEERVKMRENSLGITHQDAGQEGFSCSAPFEKPSTAASLVVGAGGKAGSMGESCVFCDKLHKDHHHCSVAADMSLEERMTMLRKKGACFRCLQQRHMSSSCTRTVKCVLCKGKHYPLVCNRVSLNERGATGKNAKADSTVALANSVFKGPTYLQTCKALLVTPDGNRTVRILLDSGSQQSYITYKLASALEMRPSGRIELTQKLFGGKETSPKFHRIYKISLRSLDGSFDGDFSVIGQDCICEFSPLVAHPDVCKQLVQKGITLTDIAVPSWRAVDEIDILLGSDAWPKLITNQVERINPDLVAVKTSLGWTLLGIASGDSSASHCLAMTLFCQTHPEHFWDLEMMGILDPLETKSQKVKDDAVFKFFQETVKRDNTGRVIVQLPWVECRPHIDDNRKIAEKRLFSTTRRLQKIGWFKDYDLVIQGWLEKGIIEVAEKLDDGAVKHYLPHRAVIKESGTTRIRPVFDASAKDSSGISLNTLLEAGPNLIELIPVSLTNFRLGKIGVSADIESAFLQIEVASEDRDMLRFLWWNEDKIIEMRHCRVVFGVKCSPFLLGAVLNYVFDNAPAELQPLAQKLKKSFYVDNLLCGIDNENELDNFIKSSKELLSLAGFNLRSWADGKHNPTNVENILGLDWYCGSDLLGCNLKRLQGLPQRITKRVLLSVSQRMHDPIGFTTPVSLLPKLLYQEACEKQLGWDEKMPQQLAEPFGKWAEEIKLIGECKIPRRLFVNDASTLHVFCDASQRAYACCVFIRTELGNRVEVGLVMAKTRVAPTKIKSIPRLELMAALIGVRIVTLAQAGLRQSLTTYFWSDSAVVIDWIQGNGKWSVFVHNRVKEIIEFTDPSQWKHIPGAINPADLLSRGCTPGQLVESRWWEGPEWLCLGPNEWPVSAAVPNPIEVDKERRKNAVVTYTVLKEFSLTKGLAQLSSSYTKIVKRVSVLIKFLCWKFASFRLTLNMGGGDDDEFLKSELALFRAVQRDCFNNDLKACALKNLSCYKDETGLLRLKTRVVDDENSQSYQFPVILPARHPVIIRLIEEEHRKTHAGVSAMMVILREKLWLLRGRQTITKVVRKCLVCRRHRVKPLEVPFPPLPKERTNIVSTFQTTGLDLAGPLHLKTGEKAWVVIFTCGVYRAVHLELVLSLSSEALIKALRRFIARRGRPMTLYSDNGTNFIGLENEMAQLDWCSLKKECDLQRIKWRFNVPTGAWWGGFWERLIRVLKDLLKKNLGHALLDYTEMSTVLCDCEAIMNSRPLTYLSEDPSELAPLTPSMFLITLPHNEVADLDNIEMQSPQSRLRYLQELRQSLRTRFKNEYLGFLRSSGLKRTDVVSVGDIVLVGSEKKRLNWIMGKVVEVRPGRDGVTRVARLKTANGELVRPLQKLYPLEISSDVGEKRSAHAEEQEDHSSGEKLSEYEDSVDDVEEEGYVDGKSQDRRLLQKKTESCSQNGSSTSDGVTSITEVYSRVGRKIKPRNVLDL